MIRTTRGLAAVLFVIGSVAAYAKPIDVRVNGNMVNFGAVGPREMSGRVMVPLRGVLEKMGAYVSWDSATQTVFAERGDMSMTLPIGSYTAKVNGRNVNLDVPATTFAGTTMVPLRFVSEALGADVRWDAPTQTVFIDTGAQTSVGSTTIPSRPGAIYDDPGRISPPTTVYNPPNRVQTNPPARFHRTRRIVLNSGTVLPVKLDQSISSRDTQTGDRFTATLESGYNELPAGTRVVGAIREVIPARSGKPGVVDMDFRQIEMPDGQRFPIDGSLISLDNKNVIRHADGTIEARAGSSKNNDRLKWVGIGAAGGLIVGALTKQNTLLSLLLGAGAGYLYNEVGNNKNKSGDVSIKEGTQFGVRLDRQVAFDAPADYGANDQYFRR